jgi:hypothetical protein
MTTCTDKLKYWQDILSLWETSAKTQKGFCDEHGIKPVDFRYWRKRLRELFQDSTPKGLDIACFNMVPAPSMSPNNDASRQIPFETKGISIFMDNGSASISIKGVLDIRMLSRILAACSPVEHGTLFEAKHVPG